MTEVRRVVADTSVFIGREAERFSAERLDKYELAVSAITLGELRLGVLNAVESRVQAERLQTYQDAQQLMPLPVDEDVSDAWALLVAQLRQAGRKAPVNDTWIAATAIRHEVPVLTQDGDYDGMPGVAVIRL